jgi:excisionase family DNA binding protein
MKVDLEKLLTISQASRMLGISETAIIKAVRDRRLREVQFGGRSFIPIDQVKGYEVNAMKVKAGKQAAKKRKRTNHV